MKMYAAVLSGQAPWSTFLGFVLNLANRLYVGWFGLFMFPVLSLASLAYVAAFIAAAPVDTSGIREPVAGSLLYGNTFTSRAVASCLRTPSASTSTHSGKQLPWMSGSTTAVPTSSLCSTSSSGSVAGWVVSGSCPSASACVPGSSWPSQHLWQLQQLSSSSTPLVKARSQMVCPWVSQGHSTSCSSSRQSTTSSCIPSTCLVWQGSAEAHSSRLCMARWSRPPFLQRPPVMCP